MAHIEAHACAEDRAGARIRTHRAPTLVAAFMALLMLASIGFVTPVSANGRGGTQADRVVAAVTRHIGARYRWGSTGPSSFDCSGLVYRAFRQAGLARRIGGFNTAQGYYRTFQRRGKTSRTGGQPGDIVVYNHGGHVGIYLGHGTVISALLSGVKRHSLKALDIRFTTFIHLGLGTDSSSVAARISAPTWRRAARTLSLRASPGRHATVLRSVQKGKRLRVLAVRHHRGQHGTWVKVRLSGGDKGWVRRSFTRMV